MLWIDALFRRFGPPPTGMTAMSAARPTTLPRLILALLFAVAAPSLADARSLHRHGHHHTHDAGTTTGQTGVARGHPARDEHVRAASEEIDKVLDGKIKNICRGC
jgi:hypothetical protein